MAWAFIQRMMACSGASAGEGVGQRPKNPLSNATRTHISVSSAGVAYTGQHSLLWLYLRIALKHFQSLFQGPVAQWIRHRPTEPGIAGSSPAGFISPWHVLILSKLQVCPQGEMRAGQNSKGACAHGHWRTGACVRDCPTSIVSSRTHFHCCWPEACRLGSVMRIPRHHCRCHNARQFAHKLIPP
jgi:hypothetical protein